MKNKAYMLIAAVALTSCNYLDIEPVGQVIPHKTSEYRALLTEGYFRFPYLHAKSYTGLLADEVGYFDEGGFFDSNTASELARIFTWQYGAQSYELPYQDYYRAIFQANAVIDGIDDADQDSAEPKGQILGEAYALRAYAHFDLVNLYAPTYNASTAATDRGIALYTRIDIEQKFRPTNVAAVYAQIVEDLRLAEAQMSLERQTESTLNYRFSLDALSAFKARVMLYMGAYEAAYEAATSLFAGYELVEFNGLTDKTKLPWKATSQEAILALERPFSGASNDLLSASLLSERLLALFDRQNDNRFAYLRSKTIYDANNKPIISGYVADRSSSDRVSIHLSEMYLIAAESGAHLPGKLAAAKTHLLDLQAKRMKPAAMDAQRAKVEAMDADALLAEIADERARELLLEGHRWMDLRRTTQPEIVKSHGGSSYTLHVSDSRYTLPFPQSAIDNNPELKE